MPAIPARPPRTPKPTACGRNHAGRFSSAKRERPRTCPKRFQSIFRSLLTVFLVTATACLSGCGYTIGNAYQSDISTVYVPIFTCEDFRRGVEFQLTEAVQTQIKQRTPFRLAKDETADTKLTGKIKSIHKNVLGTTAFNDPRELQIQYAVEVTWEDLRTGRILAQQQVKIEPEVAHLIATGDFAPEVGQSLATATQSAIDKMARNIVDMMQAPW
jgi:outer membrane lipopolysaccharide assembly protein LptE/RlpB